MIKPLIIAISAMVFSSAALAAAHTAAPATAPAKEDKTMAKKPPGSATKDATGKTEANRENKMSPTGQNETSSVSANKKKRRFSGSSMKTK